MAGETDRTRAVCLRIVPWSRTSHVVQWLTPRGKLATVVRGAVRPKSFFLGQYDLNYTCEIVHYRHGSGDLHPLRDCAPVALRENLRGSYRVLMLADHFRRLAGDLAPVGPEAETWLALLESALDALNDFSAPSAAPRPAESERLFLMRALVRFEINALEHAGLRPGIEAAEEGAFVLRGERRLPVASETARLLRVPSAPASAATVADAIRVLGVFLAFHLEQPSEPRRILVTELMRPTGPGRRMN